MKWLSIIISSTPFVRLLLKTVAHTHKKKNKRTSKRLWWKKLGVYYYQLGYVRFTGLIRAREMRAPGSAAIRLECAQLSWVIIIKERERNKGMNNHFWKPERFFYLSKYTYIMTGGIPGGARASQPAYEVKKRRRWWLLESSWSVFFFCWGGWILIRRGFLLSPHIYIYIHTHTHTHSQNKLCALLRPRPLATLISLGPPRLRPP